MKSSGYFEQHAEGCTAPTGGSCSCQPTRFPPAKAYVPSVQTEEILAALRAQPGIDMNKVTVLYKELKDIIDRDIVHGIAALAYLGSVLQDLGEDL